MQKHRCHWPDCAVEVPPHMWGCKPHWFRLPAELRMRIWRAYRPGQEVDKKPSVEYVEAKKARAWVNALSKLTPLGELK